ncbi:hypothetical protein GCM10010836_00080 [Aminobacter aminovorans]
MFLARSDFHDPGFLVPFALAALGLTLSIGLTASSIAIMGSVDASKGGAAGSLEATGYERWPAIAACPVHIIDRHLKSRGHADH